MSSDSCPAQPCLLLPPAGIGGVHRGGEASMDISADLTELGRTPVSRLRC